MARAARLFFMKFLMKFFAFWLAYQFLVAEIAPVYGGLADPEMRDVGGNGPSSSPSTSPSLPSSNASTLKPSRVKALKKKFKGMTQEELNKALFDAAGQNKVDEIEVLIKIGAEIESTSGGEDETPLLNAAKKGSAEAAKVLLENGANTEAKGSFGQTPLHYASLLGHLAIVEALIKNGADVDARNDLKRVPLHWASIFGHVEVVKELLKNGADVDAVDINNETSLQEASEYAHVGVVKALLEYGADKSIPDDDGETPKSAIGERVSDLSASDRKKLEKLLG